MIITMSKINPSIICGLCFFVLGCVQTLNFGKNQSQEVNSRLAVDEYSKKIARLNKAVQQNPKPSQKKDAHLKLARLYSDYKNPKLNYNKALEQLEIYVSMEKSGHDDDTQNWLAVLREIERLSREIAVRNQKIIQISNQLKKSKKAKFALKETNKKLTREEIKLRDKNRRLEESNRKLQKTIEMLKNLDRRLEEKRKNFNK